MQVGGRALNWKADCMTLDLVNCSVVEQYACLGGSMKVGREYSVLEGRKCDPGPGQLSSSVPAKSSMRVGREHCKELKQNFFRYLLHIKFIRTDGINGMCSHWLGKASLKFICRISSQ